MSARAARLVVCLLAMGLLVVQPTSAATGDWPIADGHFFTQAGGPGGERGFGVTNRAGVRFWDAYQTVGGVAAVGYPVSQRFTYDGFATQVMQKAVFQWRPETASVTFVNVFDDIGRADKNDWLLAVRSTPRPLPPDFDAGKDWPTIVRDRTQLLNVRPAVRARYAQAPDAVLRYGLPTSRVEDMGNHYAVRLQRAVIQEWKVDVPWASAGQTTVANGGDIFKEAGLAPFQAIQPEIATAAEGATTASAVDARVVADLASVRRTPNGPDAVSLFRNAQVETTGMTAEGPGGTWIGVRLWNALSGWLPRSAVTAQGYPDADRAAGTDYRRRIPANPAASVPVAVDVPAIAVEAAGLSSSPGEAPLTSIVPGQPLRLVGYRRDNGLTWFRVQAGQQIGWAPSSSVSVVARDPLAPMSNGALPSAVVGGKGMWATYDLLDRASADTIVETARANGLTHIYLQVGRSNLGFYGASGLDRLLPAAHASGINVIGWVYPSLKDVISDIRLTTDVLGYTTPGGQRIDGLAADVEESLAPDDVRAYSQLVRAVAGDDFPLIVATYAPEMERGRTYPFALVAQTWNVIAPMDYYHRPGRGWSAEEAYGYVARSIQLIRDRAGRPVAVQPIGQAYGMSWPNETGPTNPSGEETRAMLRAARERGAVGISFFEWAHATASQWREIAAFGW